jgi:hypothetical protein
MARPKLGSVYITPDFERNVVLQLVGRDNVIGDIARVGRIVGSSDNICNRLCTLFVIGFPFRAGIADKYLEFIGECPIPDELLELKFRWPNYKIGTTDIASWSVLENGKQSIRASLNSEERDYPIAYAVNVQKLEELIKSDWDGKEPIL